MKKFFPFFIFCTRLISLSIEPCYIQDPILHKSNQEILKGVIQEELKTLTPNTNPADHLMIHISTIAKKIALNGFSTKAYAIPKIDENIAVSYHYFPLWEGDPIPITFFAYAWPSKEYACQYHATDVRYGTPIHSHPIPCAFAVLEGVLTQNSYEPISEGIVRFTTQESFHPFEGALDLLNVPFIHQVFFQEKSLQPAISLHAYGLPTTVKVRQSFQDRQQYHIYTTCD